MSVYSGFATRHQQLAYDDQTDSLLYVLQKRLLKFYRNQDADQPKFQEFVQQIASKLKQLETAKYLAPNLSDNMHQLTAYFQHSQQIPKEITHKEKDINFIKNGNNKNYFINTLNKTGISLQKDQTKVSFQDLQHPNDLLQPRIKFTSVAKFNSYDVQVTKTGKRIPKNRKDMGNRLTMKQIQKSICKKNKQTQFAIQHYMENLRGHQRTHYYRKKGESGLSLY